MDITVLSGRIRNISTENSFGAVLECGFNAGKPEMLDTEKKTDKDLRVLNLISISGGNLQLEGRMGACLGTGTLALSDTTINIFGGSLHISSVSGAGIGFGSANAGKLIMNITGGDIFSNSDKAAAIGTGDTCLVEGNIAIYGGKIQAFSKATFGMGKTVNSKCHLKITQSKNKATMVYTNGISDILSQKYWHNTTITNEPPVSVAAN